VILHDATKKIKMWFLRFFKKRTKICFFKKNKKNLIKKKTGGLLFLKKTGFSQP